LKDDRRKISIWNNMVQGSKTYHHMKENVKRKTKMSDKGIQFLIREEGLVEHPYRDSAGIPTIGVGMTYYPDSGKKVQMSDPALTFDQCIVYLREMLKTYERGVYEVTRDDINQDQFDALTSFTYNIGVAGFRTSTLLKKVNANPNDPTIEKAFLAYSGARVDGVKKPILLGRRKREASLFFSKQVTKSSNQDDVHTQQVKHVQSKLGLSVDGVFGARTRSALIEFQKLKGLIADGIIGPQTLAELNLR
jgi:lysozyme